MGYSGTSLAQILKDYGLTLDQDGDLFSGTAPVPPGPILTYFLAGPAHQAIMQATEKAKSEAIIAPILRDATEHCRTSVVLFSGAALNVTTALSGYCDYLISRGTTFYFIEAPILAVVAAKGERISDEIGQCVAEMVGARSFNEQREHPGPMFGAVTDGPNWQFFKLDGPRLIREKNLIFLNEPARLLGILVAILDGTV